jgi:heptosyltransferase-2
MKVLVIQPKIGMGDMIIYLPYIRAISEYYKSSVSILVKENSRAKELLNDEKYVKEILLLDRTKNKLGAHDGIKGFFQLSKEIKIKEFDKVFIFSSSLRYLLLSKFAGIKNIAQYPLLRKKDNIVTSAKIFTENELSTIISTQPILNLKKEKIENFRNKINKDFKHICLGVSASGPTKRWSVENYINLCKKINTNHPSKFYLAGGKNDQELINKILISNIGSNCFSFDNLKISDTLPIIKNCDLYLGNDTGFLHIACALEVKCLALFMDSPVMAYGKYSKYISVIIPEGETEESTTHDTLGKEKISFEKVFTKTLELLN